MIAPGVLLALSLLRPEALILLVLAVPIVLAYLVDPLRRRSVAPFLFLWESLTAPRPWLGRLRRIGELVLLLVALTLLALAVAEPGTPVRGPAGRLVVLAVVPPPPGTAPDRTLAARVDQVLRGLETVGPEDEICVLAAGAGEPRVLVPVTRAPVTLPPLPRGEEMGEPPDRTALARGVARLAASRGSAEIHWIDSEPPEAMPASWIVHAESPGKFAPVVALALEPGEDGKLVAEVRNAGTDTWRGTLRLRAGATERSVADLAVEPGTVQRVPVARAPQETGEIRVEIATQAGAPPMASVFHYVPPRHRVRVLVIAAGGRAPFVATLLGQMSDRIDTAGSRFADPVAERAELARLAIRDGPYDLAIFLSPPDPVLPISVPALVFGGVGPLGRAREGPPRDGGVASWRRDHPLLAWVDFSPVVAEEVVAVVPAEGVQVLAVGPAGPMLLYRPGPPPLAAFPFRLEKSNLCLEWAFTTLISNLVRVWGREPAELGPFRVDAPFPLPPGAERFTVTRFAEPDPLWQGRQGEGFAFRPRRPGRFAAASPEAGREAWFNFRSASRVWDPPRPDGSRSPESIERGAVEWHTAVMIVVWIALGVLVLEWTLHHRGAA